MPMRPLFLIFVLAFAVCRCSRREPSPAPMPGLIPEDRFVRYYADLLIVRQQSSIGGLDSARAAGRLDSLNRVYDVSPEQVRRTLGRYKNDLPAWRSFYDQVVKRLESLQPQDSSGHRT